MNLYEGDFFCNQEVEGNMWSGLAEVRQIYILAPTIHTHTHTNHHDINKDRTPSSGCERGHGGHNDREEEEEAKVGFIFQINNQHGFGTQLLEEKGQRRDLTTSTTTLSSSLPVPSLPILIFSTGFFLSTCNFHGQVHGPCDSSFEVGLKQGAT